MSETSRITHLRLTGHRVSGEGVRILRSSDGLSTSLVYEGAKYTRRDNVLANEWAEKLIDSFEVEWDPNIKTHAILKVQLKGAVQDIKYDAVKMPITIKDIFENKCDVIYGDEHLQRHSEKKGRGKHRRHIQK